MCGPTWRTVSLAGILSLTGCTNHKGPDGIVAALERELRPSQRVVARSSRTFESLDRAVLRVKIVDEATGVVRELAFDQRTGERVRYEDLRGLARSIRLRDHGAASGNLVKRMSALPHSSITVDIEAAAGADFPLLRGDIEATGMAVLSVHRRVVTARGLPEQIRRVSRMRNVASVGQHHERRNLSLGIAADLDQPSIAVAHSTGSGVGFTIAVWELEACIRREHPDFAGLTFEPRFGGQNCSIFNQAGHSTKVAGVLAADRGSLGTAGLFRGRMFEVDSTSPEAEDDMWARSPQVVNASFTITPFDGRDADRAVYERGIVVVNGSGNDEKDEANCYAFNALCVGAYHDLDSIGAFEDDEVSLGHSFLNDAFSGREYPHLVGPNLARATAGPATLHVTDSGTSYASPGVAGLSALMLAHQPFLLLKRPALVRAIMMASAQAHPVKHEGPRIPVPTDDIDDRAGVGAPNGLRARTILDSKTFLFKNITPDSVGPLASFPVDKSERVRVILAWDQCPDYELFEPELTADLDLAVKVPNHLGPPFPKTVTHTNASFADNWEAVEFIALASGNAEIVVSASRFEACPTENNVARAPMAIAWTKEPAEPVVKTSALTQEPQGALRASVAPPDRSRRQH